MNIADRIQNLRKQKGISQEELADKVGVSRQAVSKWESEQSVPDLDKVIILSEYFGVTTDYLLKGIETKSQGDGKNANIFTIVGTALDFMGLILAVAVWYGEQEPMAIVVGLIFMTLGCMVFGIGMTNSGENTKPKAKRNFFTINSWILTFIPLSFIFNIIVAGNAAPYPLFINNMIAFVTFWVIYIGACTAVTVICNKAKRVK